MRRKQNCNRILQVFEHKKSVYLNQGIWHRKYQQELRV